LAFVIKEQAGINEGLGCEGQACGVHLKLVILQAVAAGVASGE
jgi:hypothetical protein